MSWSEEPIWQGGHKNKGTYTRLYDMESTHIKNCIKALQIGRIAPRGSAFNKAWIQVMEEELQAREGEDALWKGLPIAEILEARAMRRLVLGLPPMLPRAPYVENLPKPKKSLFNEENQGNSTGA